MARKIGSVFIDINGDNSGFKRATRDAENDARRSTGVIRRELQSTESAAVGVAKSIGRIGVSLLALTAAATAAGGAVGVLKNFGQAMSTLEAITGATRAEMEAFNAQARLLGGTTRYNATEVADAMTELARAGFSTQQVMQSITGTLALAQAGGVGLAEAAEITGTTLAQFSLQATEAGRVSDVLAEAANRSNVGITDLGEALKFAGPTAQALGLNLEATVAALGALGDGGLKGGLGGRAFQSIGTQIVNNREDIEGLIGTFDLAEEGLEGIIRRLSQAGITTEQIIKIFRAENLDGFTILANRALRAGNSLKDFEEGLNNVEGKAKKVATIMDANLNGAILGAQSAFEELIQMLGEAFLNEALVTAFKGMADMLRFAAENADMLAIASVALAARALIPMAMTVLPAMIVKLQTMIAEMYLLGISATRTGALLGAVFSPLNILIVASAAAFMYMANEAQKAADSLQRLKDAGQRANEILEETKSLNSSDGAFSKIADDAKTAAGNVFDLTEAIDGLNTGLKNLREESQIATAIKIGEAVAELEMAITEAEALRARRIKANSSKNITFRDPSGMEGATAEYNNSEAGQELLFSKQKLAVLRQQMAKSAEGITLNDIIDQFMNGTPDKPEPGKTGGGGGGAGLTDEQKKAAEELAARLKSLNLAEQQFALDKARKTENKELIAILEDMIEVNRRTEEYTELMQDSAAARARAESEVLELRNLELETTKRLSEEEARLAASAERVGRFYANRDEAKKKAKEAADALEDQRTAFRDTFASAVEDALRTGNVGDAIKSVFAERVADGMRDALDSIADALFNLFAEVFKGQGSSASGGGGGLWGTIGSIFGSSISGSIGGMFKSMGLKGVGAMFGGGSNASASEMGANHATQIIIQGDASEKTISIMDQKLAEHRAMLPGAIDARVTGRLKRGAY